MGMLTDSNEPRSGFGRKVVRLRRGLENLIISHFKKWQHNTNKSVVSVKSQTTFSNVVFAKFSIVSNANRRAKKSVITSADIAMLASQTRRLLLSHRKWIPRRVIYMTNVSWRVLGLNYRSVGLFLFF